MPANQAANSARGLPSKTAKHLSSREVFSKCHPRRVKMFWTLSKSLSDAEFNTKKFKTLIHTDFSGFHVFMKLWDTQNSPFTQRILWVLDTYLLLFLSYNLPHSQFTESGAPLVTAGWISNIVPPSFRQWFSLFFPIFSRGRGRVGVAIHSATFLFIFHALWPPKNNIHPLRMFLPLLFLARVDGNLLHAEVIHSWNVILMTFFFRSASEMRFPPYLWWFSI